MKDAEVIQRKGLLFIRPMCLTEDGLWISTLYPAKLSCDADKHEIGTAVREALNNSTTGVDPPSDWSEVYEPLLRSAGLRSYSAFLKGAVSCVVEERGDVIRFDPSENNGKYFQSLGDECMVVVSGNADAETLADALERALNACTVHDKRRR